MSSPLSEHMKALAYNIALDDFNKRAAIQRAVQCVYHCVDPSAVSLPWMVGGQQSKPPNNCWKIVAACLLGLGISGGAATLSALHFAKQTKPVEQVKPIDTDTDTSVDVLIR